MAPPRSLVRFKVRVLRGAKAAPYPGFFEPCLATPKRAVPSGDRWVHHLALGGIRVEAHLAAGRVTLYSAEGLDCTGRFAPIAEALARLPANHVIIDGEIIVLVRRGTDRMAYCTFDLLYLDGFDIRDSKLIDRKRVLSELLAEAGLPGVLMIAHMERDGEALLRQASAMQLPGIISKLRSSPYRSGKSASWIVVACARRRAGSAS